MVETAASKMQAAAGGPDRPASAPARTRLSRAFLSAAQWGEALQGQASLPEALTTLRDALGAAFVLVARVSGPGQRGLDIVAADRDDPTGRRAMPADLCEALLRAQIGRGRAGSVWRYTEVVDRLLVTPGSRLTQWFRTNRIAEVCSVLLSSDRDGTHVINLFFSQLPAAEEIALVEALAPALAASWDRRNPAALPVARRAGLAVIPGTEEEPLLGVANPAGLTRAEFRICTLLSEGVAARDLTDALGISESTLRSHLRNIYAKTDTTGQAGLIHRLMKTAPVPGPRRAL